MTSIYSDSGGEGAEDQKLFRTPTLTRKVLLLLSLTLLPSVTCRKNENFSVRQICSENKEDNFMSNIPRTVDGVVLESRDERDEECVITFKTESILEKFILKFDRLHMDCHDHLYIYDGAHATGAYRAHISCDSERNSVGSNGFIITRTNFVTLRYHTDSWGTNNNGFTLIITAFKNAQTFGCSDAFQCDSHICISPDLVCDNVSHCGHGEDEAANGLCAGSSISALLGVEIGQMIAALCLLILLVSAGGAAFCIWTCRQQRDTQQLISNNSYNMSLKTNGVSRHQEGNHESNHVNPTSNGSGNMQLPAQGLLLRLSGIIRQKFQHIPLMVLSQHMLG